MNPQQGSTPIPDLGGGTSPVPNPSRTPPLGASPAPDIRWRGQRALVIQGMMGMLGPKWLIMVNGTGLVPLAGPPLPPLAPPSPLPDGPEGAIPYLDDLLTP